MATNQGWDVSFVAVVLGGATLFGATASAQLTNFDGGGDGSSWTDAANWDNGEPDGATFDAVIDGAGGSPFDVVLTTARLVNSITVGDEDILRITNGDNLEVGTLIDLDGTIRLLAVGSNTDLRIETAVTLTGGGTILMEGSTARIADTGGITDTGHLTIGANSSILGLGSIGLNRTQITNHGTVRANVDGGILNVDPGANGMVNDGLLEATQLGTLRLHQGVFTNTNGTIRAQDGSNVELFSGPSILNGSLITVGTGVIETGNATAGALTDVSLDGFVRINNSDNLELIGTLTSTANSLVLIDSAGSSTDLLIESTVNLTGGGTIQMAGSAARILDEASDQTGHLVNHDHLIHGQGNIGFNRTQITNHSTIRADVAGQVLEIDPNLGGMLNDGLLEASNTATLRLNAAAYDNTGGVIRAQTGSIVELLSGPAITNGTLQTVGTGVIQTGNATIATLTDITLDGLLVIDNTDNIEIVGTLTNNPSSVVRINSLGSNTDLLIESTVNLTGGGTIEMIGSTARILDEGGITDGHLVNHNNLIHGQGNIGGNRTQITNHGTIRADVAGQVLEIDPDDDGMINDSLIEASNTATLRLNFGDYDNTGGVIRAQTGSIVELLSGPAITNGTLQTVGTGVIQTGNATIATLTDVTLDGLLVIDNTDNIEIVGTLTTNPSTVLQINSLGSNTDLLIESTVNLTGGGTIEMIGSVARILDETGTADGHLINNDHLIHGQGHIGGNRTQITNHSTIRADTLGSSLEVDPGAGGMVNTGLLEATGGATLRLNTGDYNNTGGTIRAAADSQVHFISGPVITGGTLQTTGNGLIVTGDAATTVLDGVTINGQILIDNTDNIELRGTITNNPASLITVGSLGSGTDLLIEGDTTLTGGGTIELSGPLARIFDETGAIAGHLTNANNLIHGRGNIGGNRTQVTNHGTIASDVAAATLTIDVDPRGLANTGTLRAENTATLHIADAFANDGDVVATTGSTVRIDGTLTNNATGSLSGSGLVKMGNTGTGNINNDGEINPGASAGLLTIDAGTLTFGTTASLTAELGGLTAGSEYDRLAVLGNVVLAGTLDASLIGGFSPAVGDSFDILVTSGTLTGTFDTVNLPAGPGEGFSIVYGSNFVRLTVLRITGDLNGDGFVGISDLNIVLGNWNQNVTPGDLTQGDPSGDGFVGINDLNAVLGNWNAGTPFPAAPTPPLAGAAVPEPASACLLALGTLSLTRRKR